MKNTTTTRRNEVKNACETALHALAGVTADLKIAAELLEKATGNGFETVLSKASENLLRAASDLGDFATKTGEELAKLDKPSGISGENGQKRKMSLFKSDKVGSSKT